MDKLSINKFKAFSEPFVIDPTNRKNILMCGENGAGKSSVYDALRYVFYHDRMMNEGVSLGYTPEQKAAKIQQNEISYVNKLHNGEDIEILFNDINCLTQSYAGYEVYMISPEDVRKKDMINLREILENAYIPHDSMDVFLTDYADETVRIVNKTIAEKFGDAIKLEIIDGEYNCKLIGVGNLESNVELHKYFNEAKLTIVFLLIIFSYIKASANIHKRRLLVLDDFVTSLDAAYRINLVKFILSEFEDYQKIIFTHSPAFYNLLVYSINTKNTTEKDKWLLCQIYSVENKHFLNKTKKFQGAIELENRWKTTADDGIGNEVRQYIEVLATELNTLYRLTFHEGTKEIIERLRKEDKHFYFKVEPDGEAKNVYDLILEIETILTTIEKAPSMRCSEIQRLINEYRNSREYNQIKEIFRDIELYQKVVLHPSSHGLAGARHFTHNEVLYSIAIAKKLEILISTMRDFNKSGDVYSF